MNNLNKTQKIVVVIFAIIIITIIGYYVYGRENKTIENIDNEDILVNTTKKEDEISEEEIIVHITGAVKNEGVVKLKENSRVNDAIEAAGGLTDDADMSKINLAYILEDGSKIKIPRVNDTQNEAEESNDTEQIVENVPEGSNISEKININKASQAELETIPGIGPSIALKIINYREENGKFSSIDELKNISGIGENKYENIEKYISIK